MADFKWSIQNGDLDKVKKSIEEDASLANTAVDGRSPVMIAADYGQAAIIEYLITKGVTALNTPDKHGITPLLAAIFEGHTHCVKILLNAGCGKDGKAPDGRTYLEVAEKREIKELLKQ